MSVEQAVILGARRTPIGKFGGCLGHIPAHQLGGVVIADLVATAGIDPAQLDEVIMGQVLAAGCGQNPARQAAMAAGIPETVPAMTINKVCGSGLKSVQLAAQAIRSGDAQIIAAGGQESMSLAPHLLSASRVGRRMGDWTMLDSMIVDGLWDAFEGYHMGRTAENLARRFSISRADQDAFALRSQQFASIARDEGFFRHQTVPIKISSRSSEKASIRDDECIRTQTSQAMLARLKPVFLNDGMVTAGNSSPLSDGAAALLVSSRSFAEQSGSPVIARIVAFGCAGVDPSIMGYGPVPATRLCLRNAGWEPGEVGLFEVNEAFAVQCLVYISNLGIDRDRVNVNGGSLALGHPLGASGARILVDLLYGMRRLKRKRGLAALCIGGGMGIAVAIEMEQDDL